MVQCLLIEDNPTERQRLSTMMESFGVDCCAVVAETAVAAVMNSPPDLVLMEARDEPAVHELVRLVQYRAETGEGPVVVLYAEKPSLEAVGLSIVSGAAHFLAKPFDAELLQFKLVQAGLLPRPAA
jgi:CheY-like chemotaxis protein